MITFLSGQINDEIFYPVMCLAAFILIEIRFVAIKSYPHFIHKTYPQFVHNFRLIHKLIHIIHSIPKNTSIFTPKVVTYPKIYTKITPKVGTAYQIPKQFTPSGCPPYTHITTSFYRKQIS